MTRTNARRTRALPAALALALAAATPRPAAAHAVLVASTPPSGGTVAPGALAVALRFNSRIDRARSKVTLAGPTDAAARLPVDASGPADQLSTAATLAPGAYTLRWQVLATDGHITRGDVPFTVAPAGAPATGN
ncbi:MAG: copper resistance CopC family protein [Janthinobacterium lividum]